jgi:outer membrane assembly lipoprotein YfiO
MPKPHRPLLIAAAISLVSLSLHAQTTKQTWEYRGPNDWQLTTPPATAASTQPANDETLDRVEKYLSNRQYLAAKRQAVLWIRTHPKHPLRDRAVFLLGQANYALDDRIAAFYNFDEVLDLYPDSKLFNPALEREYQIAEDFLRGHKRKFLGFRLFGMQEEAIEMLYRIQSRSPGSNLAEKALLRTGDYYYTDSQFDLAADVYAVFVKQYPRSPEVPRVRLRQAFSYYAQFRGLKFDATPVIDAREQLTNIIAEYPDLAQQENLGPIVARIDETFARKLLQTGEFYKRTHEPRAAAYTWKFLTQTYPNSIAAAQAKRELTHLPRSALTVPSPAPATQPSAEAR